MPELAVAYSVGFLTCLMLTATFAFLSLKRRQSITYQRLVSNLSKAKLYWSENSDQIIPWTPTIDENDRKTTLKNIILTGSLLSLMSWAGSLFLIIIMVSWRFLARSRLEKRLFASQLASDELLSPETVQNLTDEIRRELGK
jgi:hypothetical protein